MIPKNAKKVFQGVIFDVYHWEQEMFDGTTQTFERIMRKDSVQIIATTPEKKIILIKEEQPGDTNPRYSLPGGNADSYDEDPKNIATRELLEETGMKSDNIILYRKEQFREKISATSHYFIAHDCIKVQEQKLDAGEKIEVVIVDFEEFLEIVDREDFRNLFFRDIIFRIKHTPKKLEEFKKELNITS